MSQPVVISLFDASGTWFVPYRQAGYEVIQVDLLLGVDVLAWNYRDVPIHLIAGVLAAPPCTDFAASGAQYWAEKDRNGDTARSVLLVRRTLELWTTSATESGSGSGRLRIPWGGWTSAYPN